MDAVTGAFSYTGRSITRRLLEAGREVRTLTGHPSRPDPFGGKVSVVPYAFDDPAALAASLRGAEVLYNTYWVRFPYRGWHSTRPSGTPGPSCRGPRRPASAGWCTSASPTRRGTRRSPTFEGRRWPRRRWSTRGSRTPSSGRR